MKNTFGFSGAVFTCILVVFSALSTVRAEQDSVSGQEPAAGEERKRDPEKSKVEGQDTDPPVEEEAESEGDRGSSGVNSPSDEKADLRDPEGDATKEAHEDNEPVKRSEKKQSDDGEVVGDGEESEEIEIDPPRKRSRRKKFLKRPPGPIGVLEKLWVLDVGFGLAVPFKKEQGQPGMGIHIRLGAGRRLVQSGNFSLWAGFGVLFHSVTGEDSVVLNPEDAPESQIVCEDSKGLSLWTLQAKLWADWAWWRFRFRLGAFSGGAYGDYTQLVRFIEASGTDPIGCMNEEHTRWMGAAGGWTRLGWAFSKKAEAGLLLGSTFLFGTTRFHFTNTDGEPRTLEVFSHMFEAGIYFSHRF